MDRKDLNAFYASNTGLIHIAARKGFGRLQGFGASIDYEDVYQELSEAFIKSFDGFNPDLGLTFAAYFARAAKNKMNLIAERYELERLGIKTTRYQSDELDEESGKPKWKVRREQLHAGAASVEEMSSKSEDGETFMLERIACDSPTPEEFVSLELSLEAAVKSMSPLAQKIINLATDPPECLERELEAQIAHAELARNSGGKRRAPRELSVGFVCQVMRRVGIAPRTEINEARREIESSLESLKCSE